MRETAKVMRPEEMKELLAVADSVAANLEKMSQILAESAQFVVSAEGREAVFRVLEDYRLLRLQQAEAQGNKPEVEREMNALQDSLDAHFVAF